MAGSGKLLEMIGPWTEPKGSDVTTDADETVCGSANGCGSGEADRITWLSGAKGPNEGTALEARRYAGIATMAMNNLVFNDVRYGLCGLEGRTAELMSGCLRKEGNE
jgi:hypothetical protein